VVVRRRLRLQALHRLTDLRAPRLPALQFGGELIAAHVRAELRVLRRVDLLRPLRDLLNLPAQPRVLLLHPPVAHRLVLTPDGLPAPSPAATAATAASGPARTGRRPAPSPTSSQACSY